MGVSKEVAGIVYVSKSVYLRSAGAVKYQVCCSPKARIRSLCVCARQRGMWVGYFKRRCYTDGVCFASCCDVTAARCGYLQKCAGTSGVIQRYRIAEACEVEGGRVHGGWFFWQVWFPRDLWFPNETSKLDDCPALCRKYDFRVTSFGMCASSSLRSRHSTLTDRSKPP